MAPLNPQCIIAGCGPGARLHVSAAVEQVIAQAAVLAGAARLLDLFPESEATRVPLGRSLDAWLDQLVAQSENPVVVLVSGDPGVSSLATRVQRRLGRSSCQLIPGISSVQFACARIGISWTDAAIINAHGAVPNAAASELCSRDPWVVLMGARGAEAFVAKLAESGKRRCFICEDLSLQTERVELITSGELAQLPQHPRRIVVLTRESYHEL
jgi:cobalt-precorrin-7 (C5)-methyltransferase